MNKRKPTHQHRYNNKGVVGSWVYIHCDEVTGQCYFCQDGSKYLRVSDLERNPMFDIERIPNTEQVLKEKNAERLKKSVDQPTKDDSNVEHPTHYNQAGIEAIDAIEASLDGDAQDYYKGNILKYLWRYKYKNGIEDLKKARWYLDRMIRNLEEKD